VSIGRIYKFFVGEAFCEKHLAKGGLQTRLDGIASEVIGTGTSILFSSKTASAIFASDRLRKLSREVKVKSLIDGLDQRRTLFLAC